MCKISDNTQKYKKLMAASEMRIASEWVILHGGSIVILSWNHQSQGMAFSLLITVFVIHHSGEAHLWAVRGQCKAFEMSVNYPTITSMALCIIENIPTGNG